MLIHVLTVIYLLNAIGLSPGGSCTVQIYTETIHRTTQNENIKNSTKRLEECGPCHVSAGYTPAFALKKKKKHGKISLRVAKECQLAR
jgi:hypothetical protein